jgi:signal-transduction protein with cAMP-binding, CBS, and nucleotidyltransferase domain
LAKGVDIEEKIGNYCSMPIITAKLDLAAREAAKLMITRKIKRLPLTQRGKIVAIVTARDLVEAFQKKSDSGSGRERRK